MNRVIHSTFGLSLALIRTLDKYAVEYKLSIKYGRLTSNKLLFFCYLICTSLPREL